MILKGLDINISRPFYILIYKNIKFMGYTLLFIALFILVVAGICGYHEAKEKIEQLNKNIPLMTPGSKWIEKPEDQWEANNPYAIYGWAIIESVKQGGNGTWWVHAKRYNKLGQEFCYDLKCPVTQFFDIFRYKA